MYALLFLLLTACPKPPTDTGDCTTAERVTTAWCRPDTGEAAQHEVGAAFDACSPVEVWTCDTNGCTESGFEIRPGDEGNGYWNLIWAVCPEHPAIEWIEFRGLDYTCDCGASEHSFVGASASDDLPPE